jgi:hypothetical protein
VFSPGWEADEKGRTAGLAQPVERDLFGTTSAATGRRKCRSTESLDCGEMRGRPEGLARSI